ncbi:hypothetical protein [Aeromicrobium sp. CTD01-1L150]|uniref:hypothetical protein n=1 Tax=Aeromicrobium sp. CTD01-1L150 TaxID=3341830 RepID=UPI0035C0F98B
MSAPTTAPVTIDTNRPGVPFGRLVSVEIRKMFDTRAGLWLMIITGGLLALAMGLVLLVLALNDNASITAQGFSDVLTIPLSLLLPVFAIVTVTSEWGQRNHLTLFTLEPHRLKVFGAKVIAVVALALGTIVLAVVLGAIGNTLAAAISGNETVWNVDVGLLLWTIGLQLAYFLMAFALATALLNTPAAVAVFYVVAIMLPFMVYSTLMAFFEWARDLTPWVDINLAAMPLMMGEDMMGNSVDAGGLEWLRFVFTLILWIGLPGAIGLQRVLKSEIK